MEHGLGELRTVGGRTELRFERRLAHPPEKVWQAISDPAGLAHWFPARIDAELRAGAPMRFTFGDEDFDAETAYGEGEIIEYDPPKVFAFRWGTEIFRFEVIPRKPGCTLVFTQTLSGADTTGDRPSVARTGPGWEACLAALTARLDGAESPSMDAGWFLERAERYVEEFGLGEGVLLTEDDGYLIRFERDFIASVERVRDTLAENAEPVVGEQPPLRFTHGYLTAGPVVESDPAAGVLEYAAAEDSGVEFRVRFELRRQQPVGCRLVLTQTLPRGSDRRIPTALAAWQTHLELLFALLNGVERCWPFDRTEELTRMYAERLNLGS